VLPLRMKNGAAISEHECVISPETAAMPTRQVRSYLAAHASRFGISYVPGTGLVFESIKQKLNFEIEMVGTGGGQVTVSELSCRLGLVFSCPHPVPPPPPSLTRPESADHGCYHLLLRIVLCVPML